MSAAKSAALLGLDAITRTGGDWRAALVAGAGGALVGGLADNALDERILQGHNVSRMRGQYEEALKRREARLGVEDKQASVRLKNKQADWYEQRPDLEAGKQRAAEARREQQAVFANLRLLKGQKIDPANPAHAALLKRAADAGVLVDADSFNDAASNSVLVEVVDPERPTQKRRALLNKVTGELADVGHSGYVQPVGSDGMTPHQRESLRLGRDRLELSAGQFEERVRQGLGAAARREFDTLTRGKFERLRHIEHDLSALETRAAKAEIMPAEVEAVLRAEGYEVY